MTREYVAWYNRQDKLLVVVGAKEELVLFEDNEEDGDGDDVVYQFFGVKSDRKGIKIV